MMVMPKDFQNRLTTIPGLQIWNRTVFFLNHQVGCVGALEGVGSKLSVVWIIVPPGMGWPQTLQCPHAPHLMIKEEQCSVSNLKTWGSQIPELPKWPKMEIIIRNWAEAPSVISTMWWQPYLWWWWCLGLALPESEVAVAEVAEAEGPAAAGHGLEAEDPAAVGHCLEDLTATA